MIQAVDDQLFDWLCGVAGDNSVTLSCPSPDRDELTLHLYLMDILPTEPTAGERRHPLQLLLRYLITTCGGEPTDAHALLSQAAAAALEHPKFEAEFVEIAGPLWAAFNVAPRPGFFLKVPVRFTGSQPDIPVIKKPPEVNLGSIVPLRGRLIGASNVRIARATISLPELNQSTKTDDNGEFAFPGVASNPKRKKLVVDVKGRKQDVEVSILDEPLIVKFQPKEL